MKVAVEERTEATDEPATGGVVVRRRIDDAACSRMNRLRRSGAHFEQLLTVAEAAQCVGCCEETIRRAYLARQLDVLRVGTRRVRIRPSALIAWLEGGGKTTAA